jgi:hypothetical protein
VLDIQAQNKALLIKFFNKEPTPWVSLIWEKYYSSGKLPGNQRKGSFWWRDIQKLIIKFKGMSRVNVGSGESCLLWEDLWDDEVAAQKFPQLFSFAKKQKHHSESYY